MTAKWKLVPVEPTLEMLKAGRNYYRKEPWLEGGYNAMLEAAPQPPKLSDERIFDVVFRIAQKHPNARPETDAFWIDVTRAIEREIFGRVK